MDQINILVTDDEREIADLLEIYLVSDGYRVWKAYSAKEGLQILQEHDIQLAILDIMMPEMDGYEATKLIRHLDDARADIPIVAMTANAFEEDRQKALKNGMNAHVSKPVDMNMLFKVMAQILKK